MNTNNKYLNTITFKTLFIFLVIIISFYSLNPDVNKQLFSEFDIEVSDIQFDSGDPEQDDRNLNLIKNFSGINPGLIQKFYNQNINVKSKNFILTNPQKFKSAISFRTFISSHHNHSKTKVNSII